MTDPNLAPEHKSELVSSLMTARRSVGAALKAKDKIGEAEARRRVDVAKHALGERGPPWWDDGTPDYNRRMAKNTPYAKWLSSIQEE